MTTTQTKSSTVITMNMLMKYLAWVDFIIITAYAGWSFLQIFMIDRALSFLSIIVATTIFTFLVGFLAYFATRLEVDTVEDISKSRNSDFTFFAFTLSLFFMLVTWYIVHEALIMIEHMHSLSITYFAKVTVSIFFAVKLGTRFIYVLGYKTSEGRTRMTKAVAESIHSHELVSEGKEEVDKDIYFEKAKSLRNSAKTIMIDGMDRVVHPSRQVMDAYFKQADKYEMPKNFSTFVAGYYDAYMGEGVLGKKGTVYYYV